MDKEKAKKIAALIEETAWNLTKDRYQITVETVETGREKGYSAIEIRHKYKEHFDYIELKLFESIRNLFDLSMYIAIDSNGKGLYARFID